MKETLLLIVFAALMVTGCATPDAQRQQLKDEIKREILAELRRDMRADTVTRGAYLQDEQRIKKELERDILAKLEARGQSTPVLAGQSSRYAVVPVGSAEGRILAGGRGLPDCNIKLVRLEKGGIIGQAFSSFVEGEEFLTVTDPGGVYRFENLPVGEYKLKWQLPDDTGWIRRIRDNPDVTVREGETSLLKEIETRKRLVPR